ncbi:MAG: MoaD/ThiS family protein [Anaerolineae bacterium]|nr:MoaD/ThiS family protein [Anaerolineae bacterium]
MSIKIVYRDEEFEVEPGMTIRSAVLKCGLLPEAVLPVVNGKLVTGDYIIQEADAIKLVSVISGG